MNKEMLNTKEVASYLNINEKQVYRLISELKRLGIDPGAINGYEREVNTKQRYDLVIPQATLSSKPLTTLLEVIRSREFRAKVEQLGGYDTTDSGKIISD